MINITEEVFDIFCHGMITPRGDIPFLDYLECEIYK